MWRILVAQKRKLSQWPEFLEANRQFKNPDLIFPGDTVMIPDGWSAPVGDLHRVQTAATPKVKIPAQNSMPTALAAMVLMSNMGLAEAESITEAQSTPPADEGTQSYIGSWMDYILSGAIVLLAIFLTKRRIRLFRAQWAVAFLGIFLGLRYLYWRGMYTLNTEDAWGTGISVVLYLAEIYGFFSVVLFYLQVAKPTQRSSVPPEESALPTVDIFVTTFNESPDLLYRTLVSCVALEYPTARRVIYVLDDGQREEIRRLTERLGCRYLARKTHEHAKAGNLNFALTQSSGEFVMVLDCDHVPVRSFLKETLGFFKEPEVAFVQTPHYFYNPDTFQRNLRLEREIVNEQDLFFYVIEPGRDGFNSSFFAGSGGIFRRSALQVIGGFQVTTLTEDLHTSMVLHAKGYRSIYLNKILAAGLAPESYRSYLRQRQRWTRGGLQVFLLDNPIWKPGLSFMQRIHYFGSIFYFFHGWPRLVYLSAPLAYLLFLYPPLIAPIPVLVNYFFPYYLTTLMAFNLISRGFRNPFWSDVYETVMCFFISWTAVETVFLPKKSPFRVTPKGERFEKSQLDWSHVTPHILLGLILVVGLAVGGYRLWGQRLNFNATVLSGLWTAYNLMIIVAAIVVARERPQKRSVPRLARKVPCELTFGGQSLSGMTADLSETGLSMIPERPVLLPAVVQARLISPFGETTELKGEVIRNDSSTAAKPGGETNVGIRFLNVSDAQHQSLIRQMYSAPNSWEGIERPRFSSWHSFFFIATSPIRSFIREKVLRRFSARVPKHWDCELVTGDRVLKGITENISSTGVSVRLMTREVPVKEVEVRLYRDEKMVLQIRGEIIRQGRLRGAGVVCGIRFLERKDLELALLK